MATNTGAVGPKNSWLYVPSTKWTWAFFLTALIQAVLALVLEA
jgi:hypothetical protein